MGAGGKREGSGRKAINPDDKRVQMVITIERETKERLKEIARSKGMRVGRFLDYLIKQYEENDLV